MTGAATPVTLSQALKPDLWKHYIRASSLELQPELKEVLMNQLNIGRIANDPILLTKYYIKTASELGLRPNDAVLFFCGAASLGHDCIFTWHDAGEAIHAHLIGLERNVSKKEGIANA